jgi:hypothetical protein
MDYWNNAVGRSLAKKYKTKEDVARAIKNALAFASSSAMRHSYIVAS